MLKSINQITAIVINAFLQSSSAGVDTAWAKTYGGDTTDEGHSVRQTSDKGFIIAGATCSFGNGEYDVYLVRTDASGDTIWTGTYGCAARDGAYAVQQLDDNGFIVGGYTRPDGPSDVYLLRTDSNGDTLWTKTYGGPENDWCYNIGITNDGGFIAVGTNGSFGSGGVVYLLKFGKDSSSAIDAKPAGRIKTANPAVLSSCRNRILTCTFSTGKSCHVRLIVYDSKGRRVWTLIDRIVAEGDHTMKWDIANSVGGSAAAGVYFIKLGMGNYCVTEKMVIAR